MSEERQAATVRIRAVAPEDQALMYVNHVLLRLDHSSDSVILVLAQYNAPPHAEDFPDGNIPDVIDIQARVIGQVVMPMIKFKTLIDGIVRQYEAFFDEPPPGSEVERE